MSNQQQITQNQDLTQDDIDLSEDFTNRIISIITTKQLISHPTYDQEQSSPQAQVKDKTESNWQNKGQTKDMLKNAAKKNGNSDISKRVNNRQRPKLAKQDIQNQQIPQKQIVPIKVNSQKPLMTKHIFKKAYKQSKDIKQVNQNNHLTTTRSNFNFNQDYKVKAHTHLVQALSHQLSYLIISFIIKMHKITTPPNIKLHQLQSYARNSLIDQKSIDSTINHATNQQLTTIIQRQIKSLKSIIRHSERALQHSHRQEKSNQKLVDSDYLTLSFRYQTPKSFKVSQDKKIQQESEDELIDQKNQQYPIQLPLQDRRNLQSPYQVYHSVEKSIGSSLSPRNKYFREANDGQQGLRTLRISQSPKDKKDLTKMRNNPHNKNFSIINNKGHYRCAFERQKIYYLKEKNKTYSNFSKQSKQVQRFVKGLQKPIKEHHKDKNNDFLGFIGQNNKLLKANRKQVVNKLHLNNSLQLLNKSAEKKTIEAKASLQSLQKYSKINNKIMPVHHLKSSIKNNINGPTKNKDDGINDGEERDIRKHKNVRKGWLQLKQKVQKYDFVRKILNETDIFNIYEYLRRNNIREQKWPIFVVEEAYKKMVSNKYK